MDMDQPAQLTIGGIIPPRLICQRSQKHELEYGKKISLFQRLFRLIKEKPERSLPRVLKKGKLDALSPNGKVKRPVLIRGGKGQQASAKKDRGGKKDNRMKRFRMRFVIGIILSFLLCGGLWADTPELPLYFGILYDVTVSVRSLPVLTEAH